LWIIFSFLFFFALKCKKIIILQIVIWIQYYLYSHQSFLEKKLYGYWMAFFSPQYFNISSTLVSSTNKIDHHNITEMLLKVALNNINQPTIILSRSVNKHGDVWKWLLISFWSIYKHGHHRQFLFLVSRFLLNLLFWNCSAQWSIYERSSIKIAHFIPIRLQTWPP
jgi:hypothetical protein